MTVYQPVVIVRDFTKTNIPPYFVEEKKKIFQLFDNRDDAYQCTQDHGEQYKHISDVNFHRVDIKTMEVKSEYSSDNSN